MPKRSCRERYGSEGRINLHIFPPFTEEVKGQDLLELADLVLRGEARSDASLCLVIATDEEVTELNRRYTGRNEPTDVLAFPSGGGFSYEAEEEEGYLGDVLISHPQAARQAASYGNSIQEELELLTVHGILHLLGYDDEEEGARERMRQREGELLRAFRSQG